MKIRDITVMDPQLTHRKAVGHVLEKLDVVDREHYGLHVEFPIGGETVTYTLIIRRYWDGEVWNHYSFGVWDDCGDFEEIVSPDECDARYNVVLDNEGFEVAREWTRPRIIRGIETDILQALIRRWEALCELVSPHVTY